MNRSPYVSVELCRSQDQLIPENNSTSQQPYISQPVLRQKFQNQTADFKLATYSWLQLLFHIHRK